MKLKVFIYCIILSLSLNGIAQTKVNFKYSYSISDSSTSQVSVCLKYSNNKVELINGTIRKFVDSLDIPTEIQDYVLSVELENNITEKEILSYPFTLVGNETDIEINVSFYENYWLKRKKSNICDIEINKYYESNHGIGIQYLPDEKGGKDYRAPFFMLKNNSNDTLYGQYLNYFWGSISLLADSVWSKDYVGMLDFNFVGGSPLLPDSTTIAQVGSFGWSNELPKNRYKYTLLYTTDKGASGEVKQQSKNDNFVWYIYPRKYYRLIYEFDVE